MMKTTIVQAVLFLLQNNLHFKVSVTLPELKEILAKFQYYNEIPSHLWEVVKDLEALGDIGLNRYEIGNEYSLVLYVSQYVTGDWPATEAKLKAIGKKYNADEISVENTSPRLVARYWWD